MQEVMVSMEACVVVGRTFVNYSIIAVLRFVYMTVLCMPYLDGAYYVMALGGL